MVQQRGVQMVKEVKMPGASDVMQRYRHPGIESWGHDRADDLFAVLLFDRWVV